MINILNEFNKTNSTLDKRNTCEKYKNNLLFLRVFQLANDKVKYTFGITMKNIPEISNYNASVDLITALNVLEKEFCTRNTTGNSALLLLEQLLFSLSKDDAYIIERILDRDLKIGFGKTEFNKIVEKSQQVIKPPYMRCGLYNEKTSKKISFKNGAILQLKADGTYRAVQVSNGDVTITSRSGEVEIGLKHLVQDFAKLPDGVYVGEMLVKGETNRALANGIINSDDEVRKSSVYIQLWDYITLDEYSRGKDKKNKTVYLQRWVELNKIIDDKPELQITPNIVLISTEYVYNIQDALKITSKWMNEGFEGSILKDMSNIFCDHTSPTQLKLKIKIELEMRCTGFTEGKAGTKREQFFGAMMFENDEKTIKGQCSGFSDKQLSEFNLKREWCIDKVFTLSCNDITQARGNDYHALSHVNFEEFRLDKDETDTLEKAFEAKQSAMELGNESK